MCIILHYLSMYKFLKGIQVAKLSAQLKELIQEQ